jgi:hypothetical protein
MPASPRAAGCFSLDGYTHETQCVVYNGPDTVYRDREVKRLHTKHKPRAAANLADMCDCLITIVEQCTTMSEVSAVIDKIFGTAGVTLSTIHKAKGLEWETVWFLDRNLIPSPYSTNALSLRQEANLLHVAITRTKLHLKYILSS